MQTPWTRAAAGQATGVIGNADGLASPPTALGVVRGRCGSNYEGLLSMSAVLPAAAHPVQTLLLPVHQRLLRHAFPTHGPPPPPALPQNTVLLLTEIERITPAAQAVVERWIRSDTRVPIVLVGRFEHPLLDLLRSVHGTEAVLHLPSEGSQYAALPEDAIALALCVAEHGPVRLSDLARGLGKTELRVRAALVQARLRGLQLRHLDDGRIDLDPTTVAGITATERQRAIQLPTSTLERARLAASIGAWSIALALYDSVGSHLEASALCWGHDDAKGAHQRAVAAPPGPERAVALAALAWDARAPLAVLLDCINALPPPHRQLARAAAMARSGEVETAATILTGLLSTTRGPNKIDVLHLLAKLPLLGPGSLAIGRRFAGEAYQALSKRDPTNRALLLETMARLSLRAGNTAEAAKQFLRSLPELEHRHQHVIFARAVAGYATSVDRRGHANAIEWLERAIRANLQHPNGLSWCQAALDTLMRRVEHDDPLLYTLQSELSTRRVGLPEPIALEPL